MTATYTAIPVFDRIALIWLGNVSDGVTIAVMKHRGQRNLGKKRFIWFILPHGCSSS